MEITFPCVEFQYKLRYQQHRLKKCWCGKWKRFDSSTAWKLFLACFVSLSAFVSLYKDWNSIRGKNQQRQIELRGIIFVTRARRNFWRVLESSSGEHSRKIVLKRSGFTFKCFIEREAWSTGNGKSCLNPQQKALFSGIDLFGRFILNLETNKTEIEAINSPFLLFTDNHRRTTSVWFLRLHVGADSRKLLPHGLHYFWILRSISVQSKISDIGKSFNVFSKLEEEKFMLRVHLRKTSFGLIWNVFC